MREVISIQVGEAGIRTGMQCWEIFNLEHGIRPDGVKPFEPNEPIGVFEEVERRLYDEVEEYRYRPRSLFVDLESTMMDDINTGIYRKLFDKNSFVHSKETTGGLYSKGLLEGKNLLDTISEHIRRIVERCTGLQGFLIYTEIKSDYEKSDNLGFTIYPSDKTSTSTVEYYNAVLSHQSLLTNLDLNVVLDNEGIYDICKRRFSLETPSFNDLNEIISQVVSSATSSMRFDGASFYHLKDFQTNLVPYPRLNSVITSFSPLQSSQKSCFEGRRRSHSTITNEAFFERDVRLAASCDPEKGDYTAISLIYSGDVNPADISRAVGKIKTSSKIRFINWSPTGFYMGINYYRTPAIVPGGILSKFKRSVLLFGNTTSVCNVFSRVTNKFDLMFKKKAFLHWYLGGGGSNNILEKDHFLEAREDFNRLNDIYKEVCIEPIEDE